MKERDKRKLETAETEKMVLGRICRLKNGSLRNFKLRAYRNRTSGSARGLRQVNR
jgi:hypothetical protein